MKIPFRIIVFPNCNGLDKVKFEFRNLLNKLIMKKITLFLYLLLSFSFSYSQTFEARATGYPTNVTTSYISIATNDIIWAKSQDPSQYFSVSTDGGNNWTNTTSSGIASGTNVNSLSAVNATTAYIGCYSSDATQNGVFKTTNSGLVWTKQPTASFSNSLSFVNYIHFFDENNGVVCGDAIAGYFEIYTTSDAGVNWVRVPNANLPNVGGYSVNNRYEVIGDTIWFIATTGNGTNKFLRSTDKGLNWSNLFSNTGFTDGEALLSFSDVNKGFVLSKAGTISQSNYITKTANGGLVYDTSTVTTLNYLNGITVVDAEYIPGTSTAFIKIGGVIKTTNNDFTTLSDYTGVNTNRFKFNNWDAGFASGTSTSTISGGIFKYINTISLIGSNIGSTPFATDLDFTTTDGRNYILNNQVLNAGLVRFRQNHSSVNSRVWSNTAFPSGTTTLNGADLNVPAGTYNITFNILTGVYNFQNLLQNATFSNTTITIAPNPTSNYLYIETEQEIKSVDILDVAGRVTNSINITNNKVDVSNLSNGIYFIEVQTSDGFFKSKFIKK